MDSVLIAADTPRQEVRRHLDGCRPCAELLTFARNHRDLDVLARWREQLATHLRNDREREDFGQRVARRMIAACDSGRRPA